MKTWIALLRGINVGGNNPLPMRDLTAALRGLGLIDVRTYIQSGNAVFRSAETKAAAIAEQIAEAIHRSRRFRPHVLVLRRQDLANAVAANPFPDAEVEPKSLHLFFLAEVPRRPDVAALDQLRSGHERFVLDRRVFYLQAPEGIGRSKLAAGAEKAIGVAATARNWRTALKVLELAGPS